MLTFLCKTKNNLDVYVDLISSHAATHFKETPELPSLVKETLENYDLTEDRAHFDSDLKREVGKLLLVETSANDEIVYAQRPNRTELMRFVKNRIPEGTSFFTIHLKKNGAKDCQLDTAYIGRLTPFLPGQKDETPESKPFWNTHALIWGSQEVIPGTETTKCPW